MESARILVAMANDASISKLKAVLAESGYEAIDHAKDGNECLRKIRYLRPDLAVLDYNLPPTNGFEIAKIVAEDKLCDVILLVNNEQRNSVECVKSGYDVVTVTKPLSRYSFINTVDLVIKSRRKIMKLEKEIDELKKALDARKDIERAKGLLMKNLGLTEDQAFRKIQKQSMDRGIPMKEIARAIILAYDI